MTGIKTNERPGTRAELRHVITSPYKVREVLDLIRGLDVGLADDVLRFCGRGSAPMIAKLLHSAIANAEHNDHMSPEELYVSACYADEARTLKRWRARARGRYTRIRKRTCHVTIIVSRLPDDRLARARAKQAADVTARRARRVAGGRKRQGEQADDVVVDDVIEETPVVDEVVVDDVVEEEVEVETPEVSAETDAEAPETTDSSSEEEV
jgi:large subunit ribosomal protein L22